MGFRRLPSEVLGSKNLDLAFRGFCRLEPFCYATLLQPCDRKFASGESEDLEVCTLEVIPEHVQQSGGSFICPCGAMNFLMFRDTFGHWLISLIFQDFGQGETTRICSSCSVSEEAFTPKEPARKKVKVEAEKEAKKESTQPKVEDAAKEEGAPNPNAKNPLDLLPPSKMILDARKRVYSTQRPTFVRFLSKDSGTCMIRRVTHYGFWMDLARKYVFRKTVIGLSLLSSKVYSTDGDQKELVNQLIEDHEPFEGKALLDAK
ncbi:hypothetical protein M0R45_026949 [Rubus argutus]|uniref:Uncharacterized protein n=1 Tax=Rubus argutus TaxID=59490 RepID=A0AAW1X1L2_RUBAR